MPIKSPETQITRRTLAIGGLAATGAVALASHALAQGAPPAAGGGLPANERPSPKAPPPSDETGLTVAMVQMPTYDRKINAYRAYPKGRLKDAPVILFLPMIKGVNMPAHQDFVRRLAKEGYYVILPDLYARHGDANTTPFPQLVLDMIAEPDDAAETRDLDAAVAFAASEGADIKKLGMVGYDNGARLTWKYLAHTPSVKAGVAYSGPVTAVPLTIPGRTESYPTPVQLAGAIHGRVLGIWGENEGTTKAEDIDQMRQALIKAGDTQSQIVVMPGRHGFIMNFNTTPDSKKAWDMGIAWLKSHGVG